MYQAIRGNGGIVAAGLPARTKRTVIARKETIEHVLWEKFAWFEKYVKNAGGTSTSNGGN